MSQQRFAAVIFDMDGVLVDGEPLHFRAVNRLLAEEGRSLSLDEYKPFMGTKAGWRQMVETLGLSLSPDEYRDRYNAIILEEYRTNAVLLPGALELVQQLREVDMPVALASSSAREWVQACLERVGLADAFDVVVTGSDVHRGKPDPEIFLLAAERLGVSPSGCLVLEDAPAGIEAARRAGMTVWAVLTPYTEGLDLGEPDRVLRSLRDVHLADIVGVAA